MSTVLDLIVVGIIVVCVLISIKKGFVRSVLGIISLILTFFIISSVAKPTAEFIYESVIEEKVCNTISEKYTAAEETGTDFIWESLPSFITNTAENAGIKKDEVGKILKREETPENIAQNISDDIIKPSVLSILTFIIDAVLFVVLMLIFRFLSKIVCKLFKAPVLNQVNALLGGVLGFVKGVIISALVCALLSFVVSVSDGGEFLFIDKNVIENSYLFGILSNSLNFNYFNF